MSTKAVPKGGDSMQYTQVSAVDFDAFVCRIRRKAVASPRARYLAQKRYVYYVVIPDFLVTFLRLSKGDRVVDAIKKLPTRNGQSGKVSMQ